MELRIFVEPQQGASYEQQLAVAQAAERLGFGAFFRSDHYLRMGEGSPLPGPTDTWVTLGAIARRYHCSVADLERWNKIKRTKPLRVGQVLVIYR